MKQSKIILTLHYGIIVVLVAYGVSATRKIKRISDRLGMVESQLSAVDRQLGTLEGQLAHVHDFKPQSVVSSR